MPAPSICHKYIQQALSNFNKARVKSLLSCSDALANGGRLTLTAIGRNLSGKAKVKHKIKRVDRLLGNTKLHADLINIYQAIAQSVYSSLPLIGAAAVALTITYLELALLSMVALYLSTT